MAIFLSEDVFIITFPYKRATVDAIKTVPGATWDREHKEWSVKANCVAASALIEFAKDQDIPADHEAAARMNELAQSLKVALEDSAADSADIDIPAPEGREYLPFQRAGISYCLGRSSALIGDEMGLGKTIQAIGINNAEAHKNVLIICPASLKLNWQKEWASWDVNGLSVGIAKGATLPDTNVVIINYDILSKHKNAIDARAWDHLIVDEAHYLSNPKSIRTRMVVGGKKNKADDNPSQAISAKRKTFLTGTPLTNRPVNGWPIFSALAPDVFTSWWQYAHRYCSAYNDGYGLDVSGASNLGELQHLLRSSVMVRRLKADVLTDLPPKTRQIITLEPDASGRRAVKAEQRAIAAQAKRIASLRERVAKAKGRGYGEAVRALRAAQSVDFTEMAKVRHDTAVAKISQVIDHLKDALSESGKVLFFAHHKDVIQAINAEFPDAAVITGETSMADRDKAVERFQGDDSCTLFIGNIQAAGTGLTLTAGSTVVFGELPWVPGDLTQAEDRAHRIGQNDNVLVHHLVLNRSFDANMARKLVDKQNVLDKALDKKNQSPLVGTIDGEDITDMGNAECLATLKSEADQAKTASERADENTHHYLTAVIQRTNRLSVEAIEKQAATMTGERASAIHTALQTIAGMCDGAIKDDRAGFNGSDVRIGHALSRLTELTPEEAVLGYAVVSKYHRQLGEETTNAIQP